MPNTKKYQPPISELINRNLIPGDIELIENIIEDLLKGIRYKNLFQSVSRENDVQFYSLTLVVKELRTNLLGLGLELVFFPGITESNIHLELENRWEILRYINEFKTQSFAYSAQAYFELLLDFADITEEDFIDGIVFAVFDDPAPYEKLIDEIIDTLNRYDNNQIQIEDEQDSIKQEISNILPKLSTLKSDLQTGSFQDPATHIFESFTEISELLDIDFNIYQMSFEALMKDTFDMDERLRKLLDLFRIWIRGFSLENLSEMILPQFSIELKEIAMALEFPRKWLRPLDNDLNSPTYGEVLDDNPSIPEDQKRKSQLTFTAGTIKYSTRTGFQFKEEHSIDFNKSEIGKTGLKIEFSNMKLDLSLNTNIAEVNAAGYKTDFRGTYVEQATITLPDKWFEQENGATLEIFGREMIIGSPGGISGIIGLGATSTEVATLSNEMTLISNDVIKFIKQDINVQIGDEVTDKFTGDLWPDGKYELIHPGGEITVKGGKLINFLPDGPELFFTLGKKPPSGTRQGFQIGFKEFHMVWQQNKLIETSVKGSLTIPKFKECGETRELKIDIEALFEEDGDFKITAKSTTGVTICLDDIFKVTINALSVGKDDNLVYLELSGSLSFEDNKTLSEIIKEPLEVKKLRIYSDGSFEFAGGKIPLPKGITIPIGPSEITITAIHLGSHSQKYKNEDRDYKYFGLDAAVSVNPGGVDASGKGIKFFFTVDDDDATKTGGKHRFLKIESLAIKLTIPGDLEAGEEPTLIVNGFLALKEDEYVGSVSFKLPKVKIAGGAGMRYNKNYPAFLIDAFVEMQTGLPLASTGLAIYGFRGLFGLRYIAGKDATNPASATWTEYYNAPPEKGIHVDKFKTPDGTAGSSNPISIGAGISLATQGDDGKAFSSQLFLLISLRNLIILEGKANVMGERVGIAEGDPPFFAMLVLDLNESVRVAMGADYLLPTDGDDPGKIIRVKAEIDSAFFFKNSKAWYVHIGTKDKPIISRILDKFDAYSYLMITPKDLEAGAGLSFEFEKKYAGGVVRASVSVYFDIWGRIRFKNVQIGGGIAVGGGVACSLFGIGVYVAINTLLTVEVPKPFKIYGEVELCVGVKVLVKKIEKCFKVQFTWERKPAALAQPKLLLPAIPSRMEMPARGIHMISGKTYEVNYFGNAAPSPGQINKVLPLDTWVETQFEGNMKASVDVKNLIGGYFNAPQDYYETLPPTKGDRQEEHEYTLKKIELEYHDGAWKPYHPYQALYPVGSFPNVGDYKIGYWQKTGKEYNKIRLLAQDPFSYMNEGEPGWYVPEQMGLTAGILFCKEEERVKTCINWNNSSQDIFDKNTLYQLDGLAFKVLNKTGAIDYRPLPSRQDPKPRNTKTRNMTRWPALCFENGGAFEIYFSKPVLEVELKIGTTHANGIQIHYYRESWDTAINGQQVKSYTLIKSEIKTPAELTQLVTYTYGNPSSTHQELIENSVDKVLIQSFSCDEEHMQRLEIRLLEAQQSYYEETDPRLKSIELRKIQAIELEIHNLKAICCVPGYSSTGLNQQIIRLEQQLDNYRQQQTQVQKIIQANCRKSSNLSKRKSKTGLGGVIIGRPSRVDCNKLRAQLQSLTSRILELEVQLRGLYIAAGPRIYDCRTCIFNVCWLTREDYSYNQNIPNQAEIDEEYRLMRTAIENTIAPIWQPDTTYRVKFTLEDNYKSYDGSSGFGSGAFYIGFKTEGTLGHFPEDKIPTIDSLNPDNQDLQGLPSVSEIPDKDGIRPEGIGKESPENMLKYYIDYEKSYPNANGDLLYAKPLYYNDPNPTVDGEPNPPRIRLFFSKDYAHHFFGNWSEYKPGSHGMAGELEIHILDPVETASTSSTQTDVVMEEVSVRDFLGYDTDTISLQTLNQFIEAQKQSPKNCIGSAGIPIQPKIHYLNIRMDNLKPLKLYAAVIKNTYENQNKSYNASNTVHNFNFQTSQYASFKEHVESYILKSNDQGRILRSAIFTEDWSLSNDQIANAWKIIAGNQPLPSFQDLEKTYTDDFERLMVGLFDIRAFPAPVTTEINIIRKTDGTNRPPVIGLWIRSNEPFNNPKLPKNLLNNTIQVYLGKSQSASPSYKTLISKDATQAFIMKTNGAEIKPPRLRLKFRYLEWSGAAYETISECFTHVMGFARKQPAPGGILIGTGNLGGIKGKKLKKKN